MAFSEPTQSLQTLVVSNFCSLSVDHLVSQSLLWRSYNVIRPSILLYIISDGTFPQSFSFLLNQSAWMCTIRPAERHEYFQSLGN